jgi:nitrite reductase (NO-forming)
MTATTQERRVVTGAEPTSRLTGHRRDGLGASPFAETAPAVIAAIAFAVACLVWLVAGERLPGGRWIVVHIFTLGVLTTAIWGFSLHLAARFTGTTAQAPGLRTRGTLAALLSASIISMLTGRAGGLHLPLVLGSVGIMTIVAVNLVQLRRLRRAATNERFTWVVTQYEHAHLAFLVAAGLGGAMGAGWIPASIFTAVRTAHIHLNVLGWAGLTVLATLTVFGPALLRVRIEPEVERRAATAVNLAGLGLAIAAAGFLITSIGEGAGPPRVMAAGGLGLYAYGVVVISLPLLRAVRRSDRSPLRWGVGASLAWFLLAIAVDLLLVVTGVGGWPLALSSILLVGVLAQLVLTVLLFVAPMLRGRTFGARDRVLARVEFLARTRSGALNLGVATVAGTQLADRIGFDVGTIAPATGWLLVIVAVLAHLAVVVWPAGRGDDGHVRSATARRYRSNH